MTLKLKAQVLCDDEIAMGPGKASLLEAIDREGSITAAGKALGMSYRRAWLLVDVMNRCWAEPLVDATTGGAGGGGTRLTAMGRQVLAAYRAIEAAAEAATHERLTGITSLMRSAPLPDDR